MFRFPRLRRQTHIPPQHTHVHYNTLTRDRCAYALLSARQVLPVSQQIPPPLTYPMVCLQKEMSTIAKICLDSLLRYTEECVDRGEPLGEVRARAIETVRENPPLDMVEAMVFMETVDVFERLPAVRVEEMMLHFGGPQNRATLDENQLLLEAIAHVL